MSDAEPAAETSHEPIFAAPFGFWPNYQSRIEGLGGTDRGEDPAYVFHSDYRDLPAGSIRCVLDFDNLKGSTGSLTVRVNSLAMGSATRAETVRTTQARYADIVRRGSLELVFEAEPGKRYAVLGHSYDEVDASAGGLTLRFEPGYAGNRYERELADVKKSEFGQRMFRRANALISDNKATLADPVSQTCTASQFDEPDYDKWLDRLKLSKHRHRKQWEFIYILQSLERYGMLKPGARGLGFGVGVEPLPAAMAAMGCEVLATDLAADDARVSDWTVTNQHSSNVDQLRYPEICPDDVFARSVSFRPVDMNNIPADLTEFDFTWSSCAYEHLGSIRNGMDFVINSIRCLRPGGLAVHTTELNLTSNDDTIDNEGTVLFRRRDFERLAVDLVSRGNFVAQFKYDFGDAQVDRYVDMPPYSDEDHLKLALGRFVTTSFGIIVRRGG